MNENRYIIEYAHEKYLELYAMLWKINHTIKIAVQNSTMREQDNSFPGNFKYK